VLSLFERAALAYLPPGSEDGFFLLLDDACQAEAFFSCPALSKSLQLAVPMPVCLWLLREALGEAVSPRQKAAMWGSKWLSMAVSQEGFCFLSVGVCFY